MTDSAFRETCEALDRDDPLAPFRDRFALPSSLIYLDGNSLGPLPAHTPSRIEQALHSQWGNGLIGSWNGAGWMSLPATAGAKVASLIGAHPDEVIVADSTSVNLFKVLAAALAMRPDRRVILSDIGNFPTDLYIAQGLVDQLGGHHRLRLVARDELAGAIDDSIAVVMLTEVDYRTGSRLPMAAITRTAHEAGALMLWDLAHSAGALPVDLNGADVDFAVGCGYKYLNGGPGAPAFVFVARRHADRFVQPLAGWMGHAAPFAFDTAYAPAAGISRYLCGSPPILSMVALDAALDLMVEAARVHGMPALFAKASRLVDIFVARVRATCEGHGVTVLTPDDPDRRGCQASLALPDGDQAYAVVQALIAAGVVGDFRAPDIMRFGFAPLYLRYVDAFDAASRLADILADGSWSNPAFTTRQAVT